MGRKKDLKVDDFFHEESGLRVDIFLTPDNTFKSSSIMGVEFTGATASEVYNKAWKFVDENYKLTFIPVIQLDKIEPFAQNIWSQASFVGMRVHRFYYAVNPQEKLFRLDWDMVKEPQYAKEFYLGMEWRRSGRTFAPPVSVGDTAYLPYDEKTWQGALQLVAVIDSARQRVDKLMETPELGQAVLKKAGVNPFLLESGE